MSTPTAPSHGAEGPPTALLVLSALARAELHRGDPDEQVERVPGVTAWMILEHLGLPPRSGAARAARRELHALLAGGWVTRARRHGREVWSVTAAGAQRLRAARRSGREEQLPESPQHLAWRSARTLAALELERLRSALGEGLQQAATLLAAEEPPHSDRWFELAGALSRAAWSVGSASHCLYEWQEPDDARDDIDRRLEPGDRSLSGTQAERARALRAGRRNTRLWHSPE